ncbi:SFCGS family glycine-rich protein [Enemella sp. A6]|uniref:SFCGS family glycine-rich protein n=1 Tax=Enemella sp. A6 TaxID=3440152 RepID=UPI003EBC993C
MKPVKVVIGHRLGKGQQVAAGVEAAGGTAVVIPGVGADMKLGDVMHAENADLGISFCGSGGAGAVTANTKYGYPMEFGLRSVDAGVTAVQNGAVVVGFGFLDSEDLGRRLVEAFRKAHPEGDSS